MEIKIVNNFKELDPKKMICILGVLDNQNGRLIEKEMLNWLLPKYNVISVIQSAPGKQFEYPAIKYALDYSKEHQCDVLYVHTKGAANPSHGQKQVREMWRREFVNQYDTYKQILQENIDKPTVVTPFTGINKVTWYNGFFINYEVAKIYDLQFVDRRYFYECIFHGHDEIQVIGRIMDNVDNQYVNGKTIFNTPSKAAMQNYINKIQVQ